MRWLLPLLGAVALSARPASAQLPLFVAGQAGATFDVGSENPNAGTGFAYQGAVGVHLSRISFGGEYGHHDLGGGRKARVLGAFIRLSTLSTSKVRPYFVAGLADYKYIPSVSTKSHSVGGSIGPGLLVPLGGPHAELLIELRFHSGFERIANFTHREFITIGAGIQLGL